MSQTIDTLLALAHRQQSTETDLFWLNQLTHLPHGHLLDNPSGLPRDTDVRLVHATAHLDDILETGRLLPGPGCLLSAVYTVPAQETDDLFRVHNYGDSVFRHIDPSVVFSQLLVTVPSRHAGSPTPISYLLLGNYYYTLLTHELTHIDGAPIDDVIAEIRANIAPHRAFIEQVRQRYETRTLFTQAEEAATFLDNVHTIARDLPVFAFALFEAISQCLMLISEDKDTVAYADRGEPHNSLYVTLMHDIVAQNFDRFNAELFNPSYKALVMALEKGIADGVYNLSIDDLTVATANQLTYLLAGEVCRTNTSLPGHLLYLHVLRHDKAATQRVGELTSQNAYRFWKDHGISLVYNATTIKGEIGINPTLPADMHDIVLLERTDRGVAIKKQLAVTVHPGGER